MPDRETNSSSAKTAGELATGAHRLAGVEVHRRPGRVVVRVTEQGSEPRQEELLGVRVTAGRSAVNELRLEDGSASGTHFELRLRPSGVELRDLGSTNGTWIGACRVEHVWIEPGVEFKAGLTLIEVVSVDNVDVPIVEDTHFGDMMGSSPQMREVFTDLQQVADSGSHLLMIGGVGTGKEHAARGVHARGDRASGPFVVLDCASLPLSKARAAFLGHQAGAFEGATEDTAGVLERASGGTLFLDEVGELPMDAQADLQRALETGKVTRVGEDIARAVDVRVLAASRRDPRRLVGEGSFRESLYFQLVSHRIELPALRHREDDAVELALRFVRAACAEASITKSLSESAIAAIRQHDWPGNVRELKRTIQRAVNLATGVEIGVDDLRLGRGPGRDRLDDLDLLSRSRDEALAAFERQYYRRLMAETLGDVGEAARRTGQTRAQVREVLDRLKL